MYKLFDAPFQLIISLVKSDKKCVRFDVPLFKGEVSNLSGTKALSCQGKCGL